MGGGVGWIFLSLSLFDCRSGILMFCMALWQRLVLRWWYRGGWGGFVFVVYALYRGHGSGIYAEWYWDIQENWNLMWTGWRPSEMFFLLLVFWFLWVIAVWNETNGLSWTDNVNRNECLVILTWGKKSHQLFSLGLPVPLPALIFSQVYGWVPWRFFPRVSVCVGIRGPLQHETAEAGLLKETWPSVLFSSSPLCRQNCFLWSSASWHQSYFLRNTSAVVLWANSPATKPHPHSFNSIRLFCMPVSQILDILLQARHICYVLAPTDVSLTRYFHLVD